MRVRATEDARWVRTAYTLPQRPQYPGTERLTSATDDVDAQTAVVDGGRLVKSTRTEFKMEAKRRAGSARR